ncbi:MAG: Stp1/IreP family PP2C-type Ser/Thr phosphatase [Gammaproteobacteria bacterium]|nr:Stp1/IreP family PP2C-type Ser/Thr phosphatase [Gammaproteobacteria bacterium]
MHRRLHRAIEITGITDTGCIRSNNEDCIVWNSNMGLAILSDGMGGAKAGEVASRIAAETVLKEVADHIHDLSSGWEATGHGEQLSRAGRILRNAVHKANSVILRIAQEQPECHGMGATNISVLFYDNHISVAHVGDSRLYLMRQDLLQQVTEDHTVIQEIIKGGIYSREQAQENINKNIVTRAVGVTADLNVDIVEQQTIPEDLYLLCSDGLTDLVSDAEIQHLMELGHGLDRIAQSLVDLAKQHGGSDNISVILITILKPYPAKSNFRRRVLNWFS